MIHGGVDAPYELACGEIAGATRYYLGKKFNHTRASDNNIPKYTNSSSIGAAPTGNNLWPLPWPAQTFDRATGDYDFRQSNEIGWQAVAAQRNWHGTPGFKTQAGGFAQKRVSGIFTGFDAGLKTYNDLYYQKEQAFNDTSKYTTYDEVVLYTRKIPAVDHVENICGTDFNIRAEKISSAINTHTVTQVDPLSGVITRPTNDSSIVGTGFDEGEIDSAITNARIVALNGLDAFNGISSQPYSDISIAAAGDGYNLSHMIGGTPLQNVEATFTLKGIDFSVSSRTCNPDDDTTVNTGDFISQHVKLTLSDTLLKIEYQSYEFFQPSPYDAPVKIQLVDYTRTITLSGSNSWNNLQADIDSLLAYYTLSNKNHLGQLRRDQRMTFMPLVTRRETADANDPSTGTPFPPTEAAKFDGAIIGAPLDKVCDTYYGFWVQRYTVDDTLVGSDEKYSSGTLSAVSRGEWRPAIFNNTAVTHWTDFNQSNLQIPPGQYLGVGLGGYMKIKFADVSPPFRSQNYFGPAGIRRFDPDGERNTVWCVDEITGNVLTVSAGNPDQPNAAPAFGSGTKVIVFNQDDPTENGVYPATVTGTWEITLGAKICDLPADFDWGNVGGIGPHVGLARWFDSAWPISGRGIVKSATQSGGNVLIEFGEARPDAAGVGNYLITGDHVDFTDVPGLGSGLLWTKIDDSHGSVPGTLTGDYSGDGYIKSTGSPDRKWDDEFSKGNFLVRQFLKNGRDWQERDRANNDAAACSAQIATWESEDNFVGLEGDCPIVPGAIRLPNPHGVDRSMTEFSVNSVCLPFVPCAPKVFVGADGDEGFENAYVSAFPDISGDIGYGGDQFYAYPILTMASLFEPFYTSNLLCSAAEDELGGDCNYGSLLEDDGTGKEDGSEACTNFFPARRPVEAAQSVPAGAPALPPGIIINYLSLADMYSSVLPPGLKTFGPPDNGSSIDLGIFKYLNFQACGCRWAAIYEDYL